MVKDMTRGPLLKEIIFFTIPLVLGTLLQLTYNAADAMIVGRFVGKEALAAIGTTNPVITLVLLFVNGICLGAGILVSMLYGAKDIPALKKQVSTGMIAGGIFSLATAAILFLLAKPVLTILQVETDILPLAVQYMHIILSGLFFSFIYNYLASILRAMGDSASPLIFLAVSAGLNIAGDLFFVIVLHAGIAGAAISTTLCEMLSAIMCLLYIRKHISVLRLGKEWFVFDRRMFVKTVSFGFVSAMQQSSVQIGKLCTQSFVNTMGVNATAAFNAVNRFDDFATIPQQNIAHAMTSVMAQNEGAHLDDRVRKSYFLGMRIEIIYGIAIGLVTWLFSRFLMTLFTSDEAVIQEGVHYLSIMAWFYIMPGITNGLQGYFRGIGDLRITLYSSLVNIGVRVLCEIPMVFWFHMGFAAIPWSYFIGWIAMFAFEAPLQHRYFRTRDQKGL